MKNVILKSLGLMQSWGYDPINTLVISGSPRSGTTWVAELFARITDGCLVWEPLHLRHQPDLQAAGFTWRTRIENDNDLDSRKEKILNDIFSGKRLNSHTTQKTNFLKLIRRKFWIVKFVRANGMLGYLANHFRIRTPICIIRHPCAVVSSQMHRRKKHQTVTEEKALRIWNDTLPPIAQDFLSRHPSYKSVFENIETWEEILAINWCMDNFDISLNERLPYIVLPYEKLVTDGEDSIDRLLEYYQLSSIASLTDHLQKKSSTVVEGSNLDKGKSPLEGWRERLQAEQIDRIFTVIDNFGAYGYTTATEPDYEFLNSRSLIDL